MALFSVPRFPGWSFQQRIHGGVLPPPHCPDKSGPAGSPIDTLRKDSTLPPVTSKKSIVFLRRVKITKFFKALTPPSNKAAFLHRRGIFSLDLFLEIPEDSKAHFTGTRPLMGVPS